jgi:hypothetical protein
LIGMFGEQRSAQMGNHAEVIVAAERGSRSYGAGSENGRADPLPFR